jgi:hypothetical protein
MVDLVVLVERWWQTQLDLTRARSLAVTVVDHKQRVETHFDEFSHTLSRETMLNFYPVLHSRIE